MLKIIRRDLSIAASPRPFVRELGGRGRGNLPPPSGARSTKDPSVAPVKVQNTIILYQTAEVPLETDRRSCMPGLFLLDRFAVLWDRELTKINAVGVLK